MTNTFGEYKRRSVDREVLKFEGWPRIVEIREKLAKEAGVIPANIYSAAFLLGGRISEVVTLRPEFFTFIDGNVIVEGMSNLKRYKKVKTHEMYITPEEFSRVRDAEKRKYTQVLQPDGKTFYKKRYYETEILDVKRQPFKFPEVEPMAQELKEFVLAQKEANTPYLFPPKRHLEKYMPRQYFYEILEEVEPSIWPHWCRSQRASCLSSFYKWKDTDAMQWLGWESLDNFLKYSKMGMDILGASFTNRNYGV